MNLKGKGKDGDNFKNYQLFKKEQEVIEKCRQNKKDVETLKITNSLLGSEDYKRDTKLKINSLIREIDYCISQIAD